MKYKQIIFNGFLLLLTVVFFAACKKENDLQPMGTAGQTLVKFIDGGTTNKPGYKLVELEITDQPQTFLTVDLRRLISNSTELDRTMNVVIKSDGGAVSSYDRGLTPLPEGSYVAASENAVLVGDEYHITLLPGQFAYNLSIKILNASSLDLSKSYGAGFTIYSVDADGVIEDTSKSFVVEFGVKNLYDGIYRLYGEFSRADQPYFVGVSNSPAGYYQPYYLITSGSNSVDQCINTTQYGIANTQIIWNNDPNGPNYTYFTGVAPRINIDPTTNAVTITPGLAIMPPSVAFTQSPTELAASKYYPIGITGDPQSEGKPTIVAHFRWTSGGVDRITENKFVYLQPR